jgi:KipI family sensor histidine kinase inhibitor
VSAVRLAAFGDSAWRAFLPDGVPPRLAGAVLAALRAEPGVVDVVVSEQHVLVVGQPGEPVARAVVVSTLERALHGVTPAVPPAREHVVRVRYDGEDLASVGEATGLRADEVVALHAAGSYDVVTIGFLPGFAYLRGLDPRLVLPRRTSPRPRVPAASVAIAGPYTGVYPFSSPGGWHLLGHAKDFEPFSATSGTLLAVGDRVRFEVAS